MQRFQSETLKATTDGGCVHFSQMHSKHWLTLYKPHQQQLRLCAQQLFFFHRSAKSYTAHDSLKTTEGKNHSSSSSLFLSYFFSLFTLLFLTPFASRFFVQSIVIFSCNRRTGARDFPQGHGNSSYDYHRRLFDWTARTYHSCVGRPWNQHFTEYSRHKFDNFLTDMLLLLAK